MRWFQVDSNAPNDLKVQMIRKYGLAAVGAMLLLWCHIAEKGEGVPGEGVKADGTPMDLLEMAAATDLDTVERLCEFLDKLADVRLIDPARWREQQVVFLPAMKKRADEYTKKKERRRLAKQPVSGHSPESPVLSVLSVFEGSDQDDQDLAFGEAALPLEGAEQIDALVKLWNAKSSDGLPKVRTVDEGRRRVFARALKAVPDLSTWGEVIVQLNHSDWWMGRKNGPGHDNWTGSLKYLAEHIHEAIERCAARRTSASSTRAGAVDATRGRVGPTPGKYARASGE